MPAIDAVIFDLDDTLYPERQYVHSGFAAVARRFRDELGPVDQTVTILKELFNADHRARAFDEMLERRRGSPDGELLTRMVEVFRAHEPTIALYPDAEAALERLRGCYRLGLISDGRLAGQRAKVEALRLRSRMDAILLTAELGPGFGKPHTRAFELIAGRLAAEPARCLYVADNPAKDFVAPNELGWRSIQVRRQDGFYGGNTAPPGGHPQHVMATLDDLDALLLDE